jgi:hypothetical protein
LPKAWQLPNELAQSQNYNLRGQQGLTAVWEEIMARPIERSTIEHWREGECFAKYDLRKIPVEVKDGVCKVVFPPGLLSIGTGDELRFNVEGLIERLVEIR